MELMLVALVIGGLGWALFRGSASKTKQARSVKRQWRQAIKQRLSLTDFVHDGYAIGVNIQRRAVAFIRADGHGKWIPYDAVAGVELTPFYSRIEEGVSESTTRRGSQLIGAGIGAALAGPAGLVVGGLSGGARTESISSTSEFLSEMELKLRLLSDDEPLLKLRFSNRIDYDPETEKFDGGLDDLERIAARLATDIDSRKDKARAHDHSESFEQFSVAACPHVVEGWWSKTFG